MKKGFPLLSVVVFLLFCLQLAIPPSALAAIKKVIIGYSTKFGVEDAGKIGGRIEARIRAKHGKVKYRYSIIPAIAAEVDEAELDDIRKDPDVEYVEPDFVVHAMKTPDDPRFDDLWGLHNTGQTGGTSDADIDAPEAWDIQTGSDNVVIAVIDTGVDYDHEDLSANMWINLGETPDDNIDNDGNGYVDDIYGWDFCNDDNDPIDDRGHGTHCSGTIAAVGDNAKGVLGVNWTARIMALKFLDANGSGWTSDAIAAMDYAKMMKQDYGVPVIAMNNSWGGRTNNPPQPLKKAIQRADEAGILFVAATGNDGIDNDNNPYPNYPSSYNVSNIIAVAATDHNDALAWFSNYGATSVDLAAPGVSILSTMPTYHVTLNDPPYNVDQDYGYLNGTSMATPHVSGVVGLVKAQFPSLTHSEIKDRILDSVDEIGSLVGKMVTGGRMNASSAATMVVLSSFTAMTGDGKVILLWRTEVEIDNLGFAIYRGDTKDGDYTKIAFVPGAEDPETSNDYQFTDEQAQPGHTYYYYLEDVDLSGKRTKSAVVRVVLPVAQASLPVTALPTQTELDILPEQSALLANYPNPFNPATWIPYNLAEPADVTIQIYDVRGRPIRTLNLGRQPAGFYLSKDKAAYWDGQDDTGEFTGSGIYYYRLSAGNFSAIRKMVILE